MLKSLSTPLGLDLDLILMTVTVFGAYGGLFESSLEEVPALAGLVMRLMRIRFSWMSSNIILINIGFPILNSVIRYYAG